MEMTEDDRRLLDRAIALYGERKQWDMVIEECTELTLAIMHRRRERATEDQVAEEVADVLIMAQQARRMVGAGRVDQFIKGKLKRLRVNVAKGEHQQAESDRKVGAAMGALRGRPSRRGDGGDAP